MVDYTYKQESEAKFNAGLDAQKTIMKLFNQMSEFGRFKNGMGQSQKYDSLTTLCILCQGMFTKADIRERILDELDKIKLISKRVTIKEGKVKEEIAFDPNVDRQMNKLAIYITRQLQDENAMFIQSKGELSMF